MNDTSWTLDVLVWLPLCAVLVLALTVLAYFALRHHFIHRDEAYYAEGGLFLGIPAIVVGACLLVGTAWGMYPYSAQYHQWRPVEGTVAQIDNRLIGTSDGMETKFVVTFTGGLGQYGCDDTRCASVREGDYLSLSCKRAWQFTGTDGYDCRFFATEAHR